LLREVLVFHIKHLQLIMYDPKYSKHGAKGTSREMVIRHIPKIPGIAVTMPCKDTTLENELERLKWKLRFIERDKKVFEYQHLLHKSNKNIKLYNTTTAQYFINNRHADFAWLDYTGNICESTITTLMSTSTPVLAITLLMRRESMFKEIFNMMGRDGALKHLFAIARYKEVERLAYHNEDTGSPMCTFILHKMKYNA